MNEDRKRLGKGFGVAIVFHVLVALLLGIMGFTFHSNRPPEILEVTLTGGGSPQKQEQVVVKQKVVVQEPDPIVDKKLKPELEKRVVTQQHDEIPATNDNRGSGTGEGKGEGNGQGVVVRPRILSAREPVYPATARKQAIEGTVYVKMLISNTGKVEEAHIAKSSGNADLDNSALQAVYKWRFSPARNVLKQKIACYITMPVKFKLRR